VLSCSFGDTSNKCVLSHDQLVTLVELCTAEHLPQQIQSPVWDQQELQQAIASAINWSGHKRNCQCYVPSQYEEVGLPPTGQRRSRTDDTASIQHQRHIRLQDPAFWSATSLAPA
jgi:hypothetical protein